MINLRSLRFVLPVLVTLFSCSTADTGSAMFYPIDSLLNVQAERLAEQSATLKKTAAMGGDVSSASYVPAGTGEWKKELEIFYHINVVNKPVNKSAYAISETAAEENGLRVTTFAAKEELPVRELRVYFRDNKLIPVRIEAELYEDNSMYEGTQQLRMLFREVDGRTVLKEYSIDGGQEMFLADSVKFSITGEITTTR